MSETLYMRISTQNIMCSQCQMLTCIHERERGREGGERESERERVREGRREEREPRDRQKD